MDPEKAEKLKKGFFQLTHNMLCADKAAQYLYANKQLSVQLRDQIREQENNTEKNRLLLNNVLCRDTKAYDLLYESLLINKEEHLCQLLWIPSFGPYPQSRERAPVVSVAGFNEELERRGLDYRYRHGEDPNPGGDVIDLQTF
ncbi:uncharacterized protein LOC134840245 [Symsagittifera roscoffensis]|uniref:uncharacterized protein LOC134840245 n=1 Tax=Symsagittifera roscoffensis TaxID=84072 RepID=UPI00307BB1D5